MLRLSPSLPYGYTDVDYWNRLSHSEWIEATPRRRHRVLKWKEQKRDNRDRILVFWHCSDRIAAYNPGMSLFSCRNEKITTKYVFMLLCFMYKKKEVETITLPMKIDFLNINCRRKKMNPGFPEKKSFPPVSGWGQQAADQRRKFYSETRQMNEGMRCRWRCTGEGKELMELMELMEDRCGGRRCQKTPENPKKETEMTGPRHENTLLLWTDEKSGEVS